MAWTKSPMSLVGLFDEALPDDPRIARRKMFGYPAAFVNGHMFTGLFQDDFFVRLSPADHVAFTAAFGPRPFEPMPGRPMKAYACLPEEVLDDPEIRGAWIARSLAFTAALPPKVAKAKKA